MKLIKNICVILLLILLLNTAACNVNKNDIPDTRNITEAPAAVTPTATSEPTAAVKSNSTTTEGELKVHLIDVGQADSILVQQGSSFMLVDAGNNGDSDTVKDYLNKQGVDRLEYFIGTHKDEDHIGGADAVVDAFDIGKIYFPKQTATTRTFEDFITAVSNKGLKLSIPETGEQFRLGDAVAVILAPNSIGYEDSNNYSIVLKVTYGNISFLLTGDAEQLSEQEMLASGYDLSANVLKVPHHGSSSSTSMDLLKKVNPQYAVISVGAENKYGHPAKDTLDRLRNMGIAVFRTDEQGTIIITTNGSNISFNVKPGS